MKTVTTGDLLHAYGAFGLGIDYNVRLCIRMKDHIDGDLLKNAADKTKERFPYLSLRLCKNESEFYFEENDSPIAVYNTAERISLNTDESHQHFWAVCYHGDMLYLDISHMIMDGTGMYMVLSTLLYYYCNERYGLTDHTGIRTLEDEIDPAETVDPMDYLPEIDMSKIPAPSIQKAFSLVDDGKLTPCKTKLFEIKIPESDFMKYSTENDASPGIMVSILLARAIDDLFPVRESQIVSSYVINGRPMLNAPKNHHNCVTTVFLDYSDKIKKLPFDRQCTAYRGKTFIQSDAERVAGAMTVSANRYKSILKAVPSLEAKMSAFSQALMGGKLYFTYLVSYVGKWKYEPLSPYIEEFWTHVPNANDLLVEIAAVNGSIFLTFHQEFEEDTIVKSFVNELEKNNISCTARERGNDVAKMPKL